NREAIKWLRDAGIDSLNVDLIYGLPGQSVESFKCTLDEVLDYKPDRFAIFSYAHIPWSKFAQKILEQSSIPEASVKIQLLQLIVKTLKGRGYAHIGMDHFTVADDSLAVAQRAGTLQRNFQGYSLYADTETCSFGISSISQTDRTYRQNVKELDVYYKRLDAGELPIERGYMLDREDRIRREVIMRLMWDMKLDYRSLGESLDIDFKEHFRLDLDKLESLQRDGLVELQDDGLAVTDLGRLLIRNIAVAFDAHSVEKEKAFSKAV
ncbi:MAG: coproporphyrinogen III oxidase, partial [Opitutales bacterium]|nr:coproporphyrinogen III oxidase [Opitutales bacterium]